MSKVDLTTAGVRLYYGIPLVPGEKPASWADYLRLAGLKEVPEMNPAPDTIEATTLDEEEFKVYVDGLKDFGGALGFTFNLSQAFIDAWEALLNDYETVEEALWFVVDVPGLDKVFCFRGIPVPIGLSGMSANSIIEVTAHIVPMGGVGWETAPENMEFTDAPEPSIEGDTVEWDINDTPEASQYRVYSSLTLEGTKTLIALVDSNVSSVALSMLEPGVEYYITVSALARHYDEKFSTPILYDLT